MKEIPFQICKEQSVRGFINISLWVTEYNQDYLRNSS